MKSLDLFSCIGCHAIGFERAGIETAAFCEINRYRRSVLENSFQGIPIYEDIRTLPSVESDIIVAGPPCQATSVAAAVHGKRSGESLWPATFGYIVDHDLRPEWIVVEQPPGHAAWEETVAASLCRIGYHTARIEFAACDVGAPYLRRRVYILASPSLPRLEVAWKAVPSAIERVKRAANARGDWCPCKLASIQVDARSAGETGQTAGRERKEAIEALGDSNPPHMAEVIGRAVMFSQKKEAGLLATVPAPRGSTSGAANVEEDNLVVNLSSPVSASRQPNAEKKSEPCLAASRDVGGAIVP